MAMILDSFISTIIQMLGDMATEARRPGFSSSSREIKKLHRGLEGIKIVLEDAERKRMKKEGIEFWIKELRDLLYDADDMIDLLNIEFQKEGSSSSGQETLKVCFPVCSSFRRVSRDYQVAPMLISINYRLHEILRDRSLFGFQFTVQKNTQGTGISPRTSPILGYDDVILGLEEDTREMVMRSVAEHKRRISILAITGMGGIGKTTLARKIYSDPRIMEHFQMRMWVSVSRDFKEKDLLEAVISYAGGNYYGARSRSQLEEVLFSVISGKRFLLVLDDVWAAHVWNELLESPLSSGAEGSRIIVTTRDEGVAKQIGAVYIHHMRLLGLEDSWSLLHKTVFPFPDDDVVHLVDIGVKIAGKCHGHPLALKYVGGILWTKAKTPIEWSKVLQDFSLFGTLYSDELMGALHLSYEALPSPLKPCFVYCSLFPENRVLTRKEVIQLWIAEGFVNCERHSALEESAESYFDELVSRSLLQPGPDKEEVGCKMHDLIRDLALFQAKGDSYAGNLVGLQDVREKQRRLSICSNEEIRSLDVIARHNGLRALLIFENPLADEVLKVLPDKLTHLRVLDLRGTGVGHLPSSIGKLIHLRYLNLSGTGISDLPGSVKNLRNLQFLNLNKCVDLVSLPSGIGELHNLRSLDLLHTQLDNIPSGIGAMKHLNSLLGLVVTSDEKCWCSLEELRNLTGLRDLCIVKLQRALRTAGPVLRNMGRLKSLVLSCTPDAVDDGHEIAVYDEIQAVFEDLRPPSSLQLLIIEGFFGGRYPGWLSAPSDYPNLTHLELKSCASCHRLPPLGQLPYLKYLHISNLPKIVTVDSEFFGESGCASFPQLQRLEILEMPNWEGWGEPWRKPEERALHRLESLQVTNCPKLRSLPRCLEYATSLFKLEINTATSLRVIEYLPAVKELDIIRCSNLDRISNLTELQRLQVIKCPLLENVSGLYNVRDLVLLDYATESLPKWLDLDVARTLETLDITGNSRLVERLKRDGPEWSKIAHIPHVYVHGID